MTSTTNSGIGSISIPLKSGAYFPTMSFSYCCGEFFLMDQETGVAGIPDGMELAGNDDSLFTWEAGSNGYTDVEGLATCSSGFLGRASRLFLKRSFEWFMASSFIVVWGNFRGGIIDSRRRLLLWQEVDEKLVWINVKERRLEQDCGKN